MGMKGLTVGFIRRKWVGNEEEGRKGVTEEVRRGPEGNDGAQRKEFKKERGWK